MLSRKGFRAAMWCLVACIGVCLVVFGVKAVAGDKKSSYIMATKPVTVGDLEVTVRGWGMLAAREEADVMSGAKGILKEVLVRPGQEVAKGQLLAVIDPGPLKIEILQAEIDLELKKVELARTFGVSPDEVASVDPAQALILRSPMAGRIYGLTAKPGDVASGAVCSVVDDSKLLIRLELPKIPFDQVSVGDEAFFMPERFDGKIAGKVVKKDTTPIVGEQTYFFATWVELPNPGLLKLGDKGLLTIRSSSGDIQQRVSITSYGTSEVIRTNISGKVKAVYACDGSFVSEGQPVLEFEPGEALLNAMKEQLLFKQKLANLESLREQLGQLEVFSPIQGVITTKTMNQGQQVEKGMVICHVANYKDLNLILRLNESDIPKLSVGQNASVIVWGPEGQQAVNGTVTEIGAKGEMMEGMAGFTVLVSVQNPGFLRPGMGAEARVFVAKRENVLLCPVEALYKEENKWYVDVKEGQDRQKVEVKVGSMNDTFAEIIEGLSEGQEVVVGMKKPDEEKKGTTVLPTVPRIK